jgi:HPt (histidine-containing phosphotransfer) domain-containing protein
MSAFESLKEMTGPDFIGELIDTFLEDAPKLIKELETALAAGDAESFRRAAHSLKSNAASFGALHLSSLSKELEMLAKENKLSEVGSRITVLEEAYRSAAEELKGMR